MRKPLFWKSSLWYLGAPLGSLSFLHASPGPVLGPRWLPPQKWPKIDSKMGPKRDPVLGCSCTNFGARFGVQNGGLGGTIFSRFFAWLGTDIVINSINIRTPYRGQMYWFFIVKIHVMFKSVHFSWAKCMPCPSWAYLGALLAPSWFPLGTIWDSEGSTKQE